MNSRAHACTRDRPRTWVTNPLCPRPYQRRAVGLLPRAGIGFPFWASYPLYTPI